MKPDANWIRDRLINLGRTQTGLGEILSMDKSAVSRLISGQRKCQLDEIEPMAIYLGCNTIEMITRMGVSITTRTVESELERRRGKNEKARP